MIEGKTICNQGIPIVQVGVEVLKKKRGTSAFAESAIGESNALGFNESGRCCFMRITAHMYAPEYFSLL
jgi:hypothetical protein